MKKLIFILFIFNNLLFNAQSIDNLKFRDTIYIKDIIESEKIRINYSTNGYAEYYNIRYTDTSELFLSNSISNKKHKTENFYVKKKSFIKKKQSKIMSLDYLHKIELHKIVDILGTRKIKIFIIDEKKYKKRKIYLKRAYMLNIVPTIE